MKRTILIVGMVGLLLGLTASAAAGPSSNTAVVAATNWLRAQQQLDGGFAGLGATSDAGSTADTAVAFAAAGIDPSLVLSGNHSTADFLAASVGAYGATTGGAAKLALAAVAAGLDPRRFGGVDLIPRLQSAYNAGSGLYDTQLYVDAYAVLALVGAGGPVPSAALDSLDHGQAADGGWAFTGSTLAGQSDTNTTAVVIQALVAAGRPHSTAIDAALGYLHAAQTSDGSFVYQIGAESPPVGDANSTALVIQAIVAAGEDPNSDAWGHAVDALRRFQNADGAFRYRDDTPGDNLLATAQAVPALLLEPFPIAPSAGFARATAEQRAMQPEPARAGCTYFAITGHNLCAGFQSYWNKFGGLAIYCYPLTEEFVENGVTVQYFERARFEWHPGTDPSHFDVLLGLVGDEVTAGRATQAPFVPTAAKAGCTFFAATGHNLCAGFAGYWNQFGGLAAYGMPISEEFQEKNPDTGQVYTVQYFERAR
ncbi:MAG TPA: hypothetical protein VMU89_16085, partial [Thermomicrobiaceae bacterium]|nr:hypothetical protein [Thermomicrobiaceae bacterium]